MSEKPVDKMVPLSSVQAKLKAMQASLIEAQGERERLVDEIAELRRRPVASMQQDSGPVQIQLPSSRYLINFGACFAIGFGIVSVLAWLFAMFVYAFFLRRIIS